MSAASGEGFSTSIASYNPNVSPQPLCLVLDTNVVLDCFVFHDPATRELTAAIESRRVHALVHECTIEELTRVLAYRRCRLDAVEQQRVIDTYRGVATFATMPAGFNRDTLLLPPGFPRCRDPDDQLFLALAFHARADALVSKDKAVLSLRKRARRFDLAILAPDELPSLQNAYALDAATTPD